MTMTPPSVEEFEFAGAAHRDSHYRWCLSSFGRRRRFFQLKSEVYTLHARASLALSPVGWCREHGGGASHMYTLRLVTEIRDSRDGRPQLAT